MSTSAQSVQNRSLLYETGESSRPLPPCDDVPAGLYEARLDKVTQYANQWGERFGFVFRLTEEAHAGKIVTLSTASKLTRHSKLGEALRGLLARELTDYELRDGFDPECLVGTECRILVEQCTTRSGTPYAAVERVLM